MKIERNVCVFFPAADLVDGKPDGLHVFALSPFFPAVLLHEADQEAAVWLSGSVGMLQHQLELRVQPEGGWKKEAQGLNCSSLCISTNRGPRQGQPGQTSSYSPCSVLFTQ